MTVHSLEFLCCDEVTLMEFLVSLRVAGLDGDVGIMSGLLSTGAVECRGTMHVFGRMPSGCKLALKIINCSAAHLTSRGDLGIPMHVV